MADLENLFKEDEDGATHIQVQINGGIPAGFVAMVIFNCPLTEVEGSIHPAFKLSAVQAMEVGCNLIHMAKLAGQYRPIAESEEDRCTTLTKAGQCVLKRGHDGNHGVIDESQEDRKSS